MTAVFYLTSVATTAIAFPFKFQSSLMVMGRPDIWVSYESRYGTVSGVKFRQPNVQNNFIHLNEGFDNIVAMLYTGDDDGWRHARQAMTPFFYKKDFTTLDKDMDRILVKHLDNAVKNSDGMVELLNMTLNITIDLVVQVLYGIELPKDEFDILVKALAAYIVPGSPNQGTFPGGMTAFE